MNFLKRAGAILMLVAVFASSCNKYADDFKQINTKLDALAQQVAGVTTLSTSLTALTAQVTALQTAVAGLPNTTSITALQTALSTNATAIAAIQTTLTTIANAGTATKAVVDGLKTDLTALAAKVAADNAALKLQITAIGTSNDAQTVQLTKALADNVTLAAAVADLQTALNGLAQTGVSTDTQTALTIQGLQLMLNAQAAQLAIILANTSMFIGDVNVTSDAEVTFYLAKIAQLGIVNGNVNVNFAGISASKLADARKITKSIGAIIGTTGTTANKLTVNFKVDDAVDFTALVSVAGSVTLTGGDKAVGADVILPALTTVGGVLVLDYDGPYASTTLTNVGGDLFIVNKAVSSSKSPLGTTLVSFPSIVVASGKNVGDVYSYSSPIGATGIIRYALATEVTLGGGVSSLTADVATTVKLTSVNIASGLAIGAPIATTVDLASLKTIGGNTTGGDVAVLSIVADPTATVKLDNFANFVASNPTTTIPVDVTIAGPTTISLPKYVMGLLTSDATTVTLGLHDGGTNPVLPAVTSLTYGALNKTLNLSNYATLVQAAVTGKTQTKWVNCTAVVNATVNPALTTLTLGGVLNTVTLIAATPASSLIKLTSITTSGQINVFGMQDVDAITTGLTLGHTQFVGATGFGADGSELYIFNNDKLSVLKTTALDKLNFLYVMGNAKLLAFDFSSYTNLKDDNSAFTVIITGNGSTALGTATFSPALPVTGSTPYQEAVIKSNSILTLKSYFAKAAAVVAAAYAADNTVLVMLGTETSIDINLATPTSTGGLIAKKLATEMSNNAAVSVVIVDATDGDGINTLGEMALVVAE